MDRLEDKDTFHSDAVDLNFRTSNLFSRLAGTLEYLSLRMLQPDGNYNVYQHRMDVIEIRGMQNLLQDIAKRQEAFKRFPEHVRLRGFGDGPSSRESLFEISYFELVHQVKQKLVEYTQNAGSFSITEFINLYKVIGFFDYHEIFTSNPYGTLTLCISDDELQRKDILGEDTDNEISWVKFDDGYSES